MLGFGLIVSLLYLDARRIGVTISTTATPPPPPPEKLNVAFVLTAGAGTGSYSTVDLDTRRVTPDINEAAFIAMRSLASSMGRFYVVNRHSVDSIQY